MNRRRVGEDRGSKEMDGCPLTLDNSQLKGMYDHAKPNSIHPQYSCTIWHV
jgi:hypothetical protein